jgi:hypothetical protein
VYVSLGQRHFAASQHNLREARHLLTLNEQHGGMRLRLPQPLDEVIRQAFNRAAVAHDVYVLIHVVPAPDHHVDQ